MSSIHSFTKCFKVGFSDNVVLNRKHAHYSFQSSDSPPLSHLRIIQNACINAFKGMHSANTLMFGDFSVLMNAHIHQITKAIDARYCPFETRTRPFVVLAVLCPKHKTDRYIQFKRWFKCGFFMSLIRSTCSMPSDWLTLVHINAFHRVHVMLFDFQVCEFNWLLSILNGLFKHRLCKMRNTRDIRGAFVLVEVLYYKRKWMISLFTSVLSPLLSGFTCPDSWTDHSANWY